MPLKLQRAHATPTAAQARRGFQEWCKWVRTEADPLTSELLRPIGSKG